MAGLIVEFGPNIAIDERDRRRRRPMGTQQEELGWQLDVCAGSVYEVCVIVWN